MKLRFYICFLVLFSITFNSHAAPRQKSELKILYVGGTTDTQVAGTNIDRTSSEYRSLVDLRMASFGKFLNEYFKEVEVIHAEDYTPQMSYNYDVTIMDGIPKPIRPAVRDRERGINLPAAYFPEDFDRPVVTIAEMGATLGESFGTKNDWYCLCLYSDAYSMRTEHPIFNGPFDVRMTMAYKPTPEMARIFPHLFEGHEVPETIPMWKTQTYDIGDLTEEEAMQPGRNERFGMVAHPGGYEDSPEAEFISGGVSTKCPDAVAIGRHGNFFHWGFAASPAYMTEEAKPVFANAIVYISQFAGQTVIARKYRAVPTRDRYIGDRIQFMSREAYEQNVKLITEANEAMQTRLEATGGANSFRAQPIPTYEQFIKQQAGDLYSQFGMDIPAYIKYFKDNLDYFYCPDTYDLVVDEDAKSLVISNNDHRILDTSIKLLETGNDSEKALRLLTRYTLVDFTTPAEWRTWYDTYKDKLFFTEAGGWVFLIDSRQHGLNDYNARRLRDAAENMETGNTTNSEPVAIATEIIPLYNGKLALNIKISIHPGFHIYDHVDPADPYLATGVEIAFPEGYSQVGELKRPYSEFYNRRGTTTFSGDIVFVQEFEGNGVGELNCRVTYQSCDLNICLPPETKEFVIPL